MDNLSSPPGYGGRSAAEGDWMVDGVPDRPVDGRQTPRFVLAVLTAVFVLGGTPLAVLTCWQAVTDWRTVPTDGVVSGVRLVKRDRPLPRARGPWVVVWDVETGAEKVPITAPGSYQREVDAEDASRSDLGRRVTVWYVPGCGGSGDLCPPDWGRGLVAAAWSTAMAAFGWLGVAGLAQLAWRTRGRRPGRAEPNAATDPARM